VWSVDGRCIRWGGDRRWASPSPVSNFGGEFGSSHSNQWGLCCVVVQERRALPNYLGRTCLPSLRTMGWILSLLFVCFLFGHSYLCPNFTDRREIWQVASQISQAGFSKFWGRQLQGRPNYSPKRLQFRGRRMEGVTGVSRSFFP